MPKLRGALRRGAKAASAKVKREVKVAAKAAAEKVKAQAKAAAAKASTKGKAAAKKAAAAAAEKGAELAKRGAAAAKRGAKSAAAKAGAKLREVKWPWRKKPNPVPDELLLRRPRWMALRRSNAWSEDVKKLLRGQAGVYAVREKGGKSVLYVGESHSPGREVNRFWKTLLRHFQPGNGSFERRNEWVYRGNRDLDVAVYLTPPSEAFEAEGRLIAYLEPAHTKTRDVQGDAAEPAGGDGSFDPATF